MPLGIGCHGWKTPLFCPAVRVFLWKKGKAGNQLELIGKYIYFFVAFWRMSECFGFSCYVMLIFTNRSIASPVSIYQFECTENSKFYFSSFDEFSEIHERTHPWCTNELPKCRKFVFFSRGHRRYMFNGKVSASGA